MRRLETMLEQRPGFGAKTTTAVTTLDAGMRCATVEGAFETVSDVGPALGGDDSAPSPSALVRAALGSCMAMTYRLRAARHRIELTSVRVTVETDGSVAGLLGCGVAVRPGFAAVRYHVEIESDASPIDVERIVEEGDRLSPILDALRGGTEVTRTLSIAGGS